jgi:hypothetical protein
MTVDAYRCDFCGVQMMFNDASNAGRFPVTRRYKDMDREEGLLAVRCAVCADFPYRIEAGQAYRVDYVGRDQTNLITDCNSTYNYWPAGIGHLLEVYATNPPYDPIEVGFLVEEDINLIVVAYRRGEERFNITPYSSHTWGQGSRGAPPLPVVSKKDRRFLVGYVDTHTGKYGAVREGTMSDDFATAFHQAIHDQMARGEPDWERYWRRVEHLGDLLRDDRVNEMLAARCTIA